MRAVRRLADAPRAWASEVHSAQSGIAVRREGGVLRSAAGRVQVAVFGFLLAGSGVARAQSAYVVNDTHFHLTNYVQQGTSIQEFLKIMGTKVGRVALFG